MNRLALILGLGALMAPPGATAISWLQGCQAGHTTGSISQGHMACAEPISATDDTNILNTESCENIDILIYSDVNGDGTACTTLTHQIQHCPSGQGDAGTDTVAEQDAACVNLGTAFTATGASLGAAASWVKIQEGGVFTASCDPRIIVRCNGPTR